VFEPSNERLRRQWLPQRQQLFDDDFSMYPALPAEDPSFAEVFAVAAVLVRKLRAEATYREGRIAQMKNRLDRAAEEYRAAVALDPTHAAARHRLLRLAGGEGKRTGLQRLLLALRG
jgi:predicted TPR repeat methyltransferase